jgi:hypothetical protein
MKSGAVPTRICVAVVRVGKAHAIVLVQGPSLVHARAFARPTPRGVGTPRRYPFENGANSFTTCS